MLNLSKQLRLTREVMISPNLADKFSEADLNAIGNHVWEGYDRDRVSRMRWETRTQAAMDLAMQVQKDKNFPWPGCSNVAFPLVTIATLQFHSRAYPAILQGPDLVKCRVVGSDPTGEEQARALRVGRHMSYQLMEEDQCWEEQHDRLLINIPIVGCAFKKTYFDGRAGHNVSELVLAQDLVLDYYAKSVEECARKTQIIPRYRNELHEGIVSGIYRDVREEGWYNSHAVPMRNPSTESEDRRHGEAQPQADFDTPFTTLEQHCWLDLDGDGYREPYIVTIEFQSRAVLRIVARWDSLDDIERTSRGEIIRIRPTEYYTKYGFIPSPDGGVYDMGFGNLLGPLNESTNSLLNQLIDAGTMANTAGGFLGRGAKIRGGTYTFAPLEWKRVDSTGDDLRRSIFPLPVREPSMVLFQLLSLLIDYTNRISGTTDTLVGENPGQNTPAMTTQTMVEQGQKIFVAIFKRVWRSMREEFKKLYILNSIYTPDMKAFGEEGRVLREDYRGDASRIVPAADPNVVSEQEKMVRAQTLKQAAMTTPGYNVVEVERNYLRALHVDGIDLFYPGPDKIPPGQDPKMAVEQMKLQVKQAALDLEKMKFLMELQEEQRLNNAKILELQAKAAKLVEEAGGIRTGQQISAFQTAIGALKAHDESLRKKAELLMSAMESDREYANGSPSNGGGMARLAGPPSNQGATSPSPEMEGGGEGAMGGGGLY